MHVVAVALSTLCILFLPLAAAASSVLVYSHASGWTFAPAPTSAPPPHTLAHPSFTTIAVLNLQRARVVVRRAHAADDASFFHITAATCGGSGDDPTECSGSETAHKLSAPLNFAASDFEPLLLAVAGGASPHGCSHVPDP
jgi:hypothetical protein